MNELRMYVEHLFEGRVLTAENIELKEEIYGNLVARYEDYVASGLSETEALARTKASMTSIDDVVASEGTSALESPSAATADAAPTTVIPPQSAATAQMPAAPTAAAQTADSAAAQAPGVPVPPAGVTGAQTASGAQMASGSSPKQKRPRWQVIAAVAAAVVAVLILVVFGFNMVVEPALDRVDDAIEDTVENNSVSNGNGTAANNSSTNGSGSNAANNDGNSASGQNTTGNNGSSPTFADPEDQLEYEATMALMDEIYDNPVDAVQPYVGSDVNDDTKRGELVGMLPLYGYVASTFYANGELTVEYAAVDHNIDGDAVDCALVYNALALLSVYAPDVTSVSFKVNDNDDHANDVDRYRFDRSTLETMVSHATSNAITQLNSSLLESQDAWNQVLDLATQEHFFDEATDRAEIDH